MKSNHKITVTVGTSAYNEERNIKFMLTSICSQREENIQIKKIIVISDGSTDGTIQAAKSVRDNRITIVDDGKRLGQPARIGQLLNMFSTDVFVLVDADMVLKDSQVIENIVEPIRKNKQVGLVTGETEAVRACTFIEKAVNNFFYARNMIFPEFRNTAYTAHAFLCFSKKFGKLFQLPQHVLNSDAFSYFSCITQGFTVTHARNAIALYRSPQSIKDVLNQSVRHVKGGYQLKEFFDSNLVRKGFYVPFSIQIKLMFWQFFHYPSGYFVLKMIHIYSALKSHWSKEHLEVKWQTISSSKQLY